MRAFLGLLSLVVSLDLGGCGGCNDDNKVGQLPDASPPPPDAPLDMAPPSPVTITVTDSGDPVMGLTVYFQESDSMLVRAAQTDADGKASAVVHAGGFVTVVQVTNPQPVRQVTANEGIPQGPDSQLTTFAAVKPGDDLHLDLHPVSPETDITFDLTVPDEQLGRTYTLYSSCGAQELQRPERRGLARRRGAGVGSGGTIPLTASVTLANCGATADLLVVSSDSETQAVTWLYKPAVAVADGVAVDLTDATYQDATDVTFTYNSVAPTITGLLVQRELRSSHGSLGFFTFPQTATTDPDTAIASVTVPLPGAAGLLEVTTSTDQPSAGNGQQTFVDWGGTGDYTIDYSAVALHGYASMPSADAGSHEIAWSEASGGVAPDFAFGTCFLQRDDDNGHNTWTWQIVAPSTPGQAKLTYPVLPTTIYDYNSSTDDQAPEVDRLTTVKAPGGYDAFRAHAFSLDPSSVVTGATGQIVFEDIFQQEFLGKAAAPRRSLFVRPVPRKR
jgi:hypothetical protein